MQLVHPIDSSLIHRPPTVIFMVAILIIWMSQVPRHIESFCTLTCKHKVSSELKASGSYFTFTVQIIGCQIVAYTTRTFKWARSVGACLITSSIVSLAFIHICKNYIVNSITALGIAAKRGLFVVPYLLNQIPQLLIVSPFREERLLFKSSDCWERSQFFSVEIEIKTMHFICHYITNTRLVS